MRLLFLTNLFPSAARPTFGVYHQQLFGAMAQHVEAQVVAPVAWWTRARHVGELLRPPHEDGFGLNALFPTYWSVPRMAVLHARGMAASLLPTVRRLHRATPFDLLFAAWAYPDGVAAARIARALRIPLVINALGCDINELAQRPALRPQIVWGLQQARQVIAVSGALGEAVTALGIPPERVSVHLNGVDGERFAVRDRQEARARLGLPAQRRIVCFVGGFEPEKAVEVLIEAMARLQDRKDTELALVGNGSQEGMLRERAQALGVTDRVRFCGRRPHAEIPDWLTACDLFCLPSRREGCPNVVLEALASGRPVVGACVGGIPELVHPGNGLLIPPEDPDALAAGLRSALDCTWNPHAIRAGVAHLSWQEVGARYVRTLERALT